MKLLNALLAVALCAAVAEARPDSAAKGPKPKPGKDAPPNILFVILDDVGIDQMETFGFGGATAPPTPTITDIADEGVRFSNTWAMPACTTSRAAVFEGRFPFRTNVLGALGADDLANSMVSPYEVTLPKLLARRGYESALFGKFHITLEGNDPSGLAAPHALGWNFYMGWTDETGDPSSIDTTAGGVGDTGQYSCGFVPSAAAGGADTGACYMADGRCRKMKAKKNGVPPGRLCRDRGGIFDPNERCRKETPDYIAFDNYSGHYVSPYTYNHPDGRVEQVPPTDPRARAFRADIVVDETVSWIEKQPKGKPWMATVSFSSDHTPLMHPPVADSVPGVQVESDADCSTTQVQRQLSNMMISHMDQQIARLLVELKLARRTESGTLEYDPNRTDTMIVILGDNGSLGTTIKAPFNPQRAKGTTYQGGVWVPLVVAGPLVNGDSRSVPHMVNVTDLYALFGEIAGIDDVTEEVDRPIDAQPMLPYLTNAGEESIRDWNYTEIGLNLQANHAINGPCQIGGSCTQIPVSKGVCEDNNGIWWGDKHDAPETAGAPEEGFLYCCEVSAHLIEQGCEIGTRGCPLLISPLATRSIRNDKYKVIRNQTKSYISQEEPCRDEAPPEFYEISETPPIPLLDNGDDELLQGPLTAEQQQNYEELSDQMDALLASEPVCVGDGNLDLVIDQADLDEWARYAVPQGTGGSSWYDFDIDGDTDEDDRAVIEANLGTDCH
jgi:hypothetical protein